MYKRGKVHVVRTDYFPLTHVPRPMRTHVSIHDPDTRGNAKNPPPKLTLPTDAKLPPKPRDKYDDSRARDFYPITWRVIGGGVMMGGQSELHAHRIRTFILSRLQDKSAPRLLPVSANMATTASLRMKRNSTRTVSAVASLMDAT